MKLRLNDTVRVTIGKDKGKTGKVTRIVTDKNSVIVEGMNKYKRHLKRQSDQNPGGVVEVERALNISKVAIVCDSCKKVTRIGYEISKTGDKVRICKKCKAPLSAAKK